MTGIEKWIFQDNEHQQLLRVVRCLPLIPALPGASRTYWAGVRQALTIHEPNMPVLSWVPLTEAADCHS